MLLGLHRRVRHVGDGVALVGPMPSSGGRGGGGGLPGPGGSPGGRLRTGPWRVVEGVRAIVRRPGAV